MNIVLFGPPGSGKGTQAARLKERFSLRHVSTGDLLREAVAAQSDLGRKVEGIMASGELVSDDIVLELIKEAAEATKNDAASEGWMLDGFPRTIAQAEGLTALLDAEGDKIDAVVVLEVDRDAVIERLSARRSCPECKAVYSLLVSPPATEGVCDKCRGTLVHREDDRPETIANRLDVYERQTHPILEHLEGRVAIHRIDGTAPVDEVSRAIEAALT